MNDSQGAYGLGMAYFRGCLLILTNGTKFHFLGTTPTSTPENFRGASAHFDPYPVEVEPSVPRINWVSHDLSTNNLQQTTEGGGGRIQFLTRGSNLF